MACKTIMYRKSLSVTVIQIYYTPRFTAMAGHAKTKLKTIRQFTTTKTDGNIYVPAASGHILQILTIWF